MDNSLLQQIMSAVQNADNSSLQTGQTGQTRQTGNTGQTGAKTAGSYKGATGITEFVGTGIGDSVGLVIANVDSHLHTSMKLDPKYRSIGIVSSRTGGAPHVMAADEAVKATNTEVVSVEFCRDTKGGAGHGSTIIFAAEDVSDARRAVEILLSNLERTFGDVYGCDAGHIELHYTARASYALAKAFSAPVGKAFGITVGAPAAVGLLMADVALKTANVDIVTYASPAVGTCFSNEIIVTVSGDSGAVRQSMLAARDVGLGVLRGMGQSPEPVTKPQL